MRPFESVVLISNDSVCPMNVGLEKPEIDIIYEVPSGLNSAKSIIFTVKVPSLGKDPSEFEGLWSIIFSETVA